MNRSQLEALSVAELRCLILDATTVLAARAEVAAKAESPQGSALFQFGSPGGASAPAPAGGGLFAAGGGLFAPPARDGAAAGATAGCGKIFGGSGGGLFGGAVAAAAAAAAPSPSAAGEANREDDDEDDRVEEEEVTDVAGWKPSISLEVRDTIETGEESEEQLYSQRSKLFRWKDGEWKDRGIGEAKLLKNRDTKCVRFLLRQEKTGKVVANHLVLSRDPYCDLRPNADSEKIWVWQALDYADGSQQAEQFGLKFGTVELAGKFREAFLEARLVNAEACPAEDK